MSQPARPLSALLWVLTLALSGCPGGGGGGGSGRADAGGSGGCTTDPDCPTGLACVAGRCGFTETPAVAIDATGDWWMLRYHFVDPQGAPPPADVSGARFEQTGDAFTQLADDDPEFQVPGVIEGGTRYVQGGDEFTAVLGFTDADTGQGAFTQGAFTFGMRFIRRGAPAHADGGAWVLEGTQTEASVAVAGDEVVVAIGAQTWRGRAARTQAVLVNEAQGGADEAMALAWQGPDRVVGVIYTREANGAPSQRGVAFVRPGAPTDDVTAPTVVDIFPAQRDGWVWPDAPVVITFSEPVDPATLTPESVRVHPIQPVDGVLYGPGEGLPGRFEVDGAKVTFRPARGSLQAYQTEYELSLTEAVTDLAGNPLTPPAVQRFRTLMLAEGGTYQFVAPDGRLLALGGQEADEQMLALTLEPEEGPRTQWEARWTQGDGFLLANPAAPVFGFVEGGDGSGPALTTPFELQTFSGQAFVLRPAEARPQFAAREGPSTYYLTTVFQGMDRALGLSPGGEADPVFRMVDIDAGAFAWVVRRVGDAAPAPCERDADCGTYACWTDSRACFDWCANGTPCGAGSTCEPGGVCTSDAACAALGEGQCDGDVLHTCVGGEIVETDCAALGEGRRRVGCRASEPAGVDRCVVLRGAECREGFSLDAPTWPCETGTVCTLGADRWQCEGSDETCEGAFEPYCDGDVAILLCADYGQPLAFNCRANAGETCDRGACLIQEGGSCFDPSMYRCAEGLVCGDRRICRTPPDCAVDADCGDVRLACDDGICALRACERPADCGRFDCVYGECQESCQATCEARWGAGTWVCDDPGGPCTRQDCQRSGDCPDNSDCVPRSHNRVGPRSTDLVCQEARLSPCDGVCLDHQLCSGLGGDSPEERCR